MDLAFFLLAVGAVLLPLISGARLLLNKIIASKNTPLIGGTAALLIIGALALPLLWGILLAGVYGVLIAGYMGLPVIGILANLLLLSFAFRYPLTQSERRIWIIGYSSCIVVILAYCLKAGGFLFPLGF